MEEKIFKQYNEECKKSMLKAVKFLKLPGNTGEIINVLPKKNSDLLILFSKLELIKNIENPLDIINDFHDTLFKSWIKIGVGIGKRQIIESMKNDNKLYNNLLKVNPNDYVNFKLTPNFLKDLKED